MPYKNKVDALLYQSEYQKKNRDRLRAKRREYVTAYYMRKLLDKDSPRLAKLKKKLTGFRLEFMRIRLKGRLSHIWVCAKFWLPHPDLVQKFEVGDLEYGQAFHRHYTRKTTDKPEVWKARPVNAHMDLSDEQQQAAILEVMERQREIDEGKGQVDLSQNVKYGLKPGPPVFYKAPKDNFESYLFTKSQITQKKLRDFILLKEYVLSLIEEEELREHVEKTLNIVRPNKKTWEAKQQA